jgi:type VI secretion system protein ImpK
MSYGPIMSPTIEAISPDSPVDDKPETTQINPLIQAADPVFLAVALLSQGQRPESPPQLQLRLLDALDDFSAAIESTHPELHDDARYALCALVDETILSTTWGAAEWSGLSLLSAVYDEDYSGESFFQRLEKTSKRKTKGVLLLELFHTCLSLGYSGRFARHRYTPANIEHLRSQVASLITQYRITPPPALSPTRPSDSGSRRSHLPLWIMASLLGALTMGIYQGMSFYLEQWTGPVLGIVQALAR